MNIWKAFEELLPKEQIVIGKITAVNTNQTCKVELLSGEHIVVKGTGTVGASYFIKDGVISSETPSLPTYSVDV